MKFVEYHGARYIAAYVGSSFTSVHNWRKAQGNGFPEAVAVISGGGGTRPTYGWAAEQLPDIRDWYAKRMKLDGVTAEERWKAIDAQLLADQVTAPEPEQDVNQIQLFSIPRQRTGDAA